MLLLDQVHTAVQKGKSFQTSPPPLDSDPEDPWKVQVAKAGPPKKHVWVSCHSDASARGHTCYETPAPLADCVADVLRILLLK